MKSWKEQLERQARSLIREIASLEGHLNQDVASNSLDNLFRTLERIYVLDLPLADLRDKSDLIFRLNGKAFDEQPRLQLVTSIFENVSSRVTDLTKVILGQWADGRVSPSSLDLSLSGMAKGSLLFGLSADMNNNYESPLFGDEDTLFVSTKEALKTIDLVAHLIEDSEDEVELEEVSERIDNPRVRDAALLAVQRLAPSGRRGIKTLTVSGQDAPPAQLTQVHRKAIRESLVKPVIHGESIELVGYVREIDLDAHRFDLRGIDNSEIRMVRCAYREFSNIRAKDLLGSYVKVEGLVEKSADGIPRLLSVTDVNIRRHAPEDLRLTDEELPFPRG